MPPAVLRAVRCDQIGNMTMFASCAPSTAPHTGNDRSPRAPGSLEMRTAQDTVFQPARPPPPCLATPAPCFVAAHSDQWLMPLVWWWAPECSPRVTS